ncbi:C-1-tetrahydrofolate synthase, mitochondrial [Hondaea fermentalgiana]|uniref:C-1-tetrahydrofolate synthase, mitochondrial n=1 Tax=Hondaea fermentalgiana TaxID=2315210 RepID=A0A2R5FZT6_9STRA|nr:C-1-tetrahydrofolate synthase, mitochondrial [Hondaea fermentalgiana]|eukprot:GBG24276.1 C-1-tetrahydrofolate synthase, mitochondrial [Hondaea fermentalgiana]
MRRALPLVRARQALAHNGRFAQLRSANALARPFASQVAGIATKIDGKAIADDVLREVKQDVEILRENHGEDATPGLAVVLVGDRPDSHKYVQMKKKAAKNVGIRSIETTLPENCSHEEVLEVVRQLNQRSDIDGILVQLPLPAQCNQTEILEAIDVDKDVDGFHPFNMGRLARAGEDLRHARRDFVPLESRNASCTPLGSIVLLERSGCEIAGKHAVVLGRSNIVGLPAALMLLHRNATVSMCHSRTPNIPEICREADIIIAAIGKPEFVKGDWIKPGATVIDVGINFKEDPSRKSGVRMCGDVDYEAARQVAGAITPVPGGVGPMTVAMLMVNTVNNAKARLERKLTGETYMPAYQLRHSDESANPARQQSVPVRWKYGSSAHEP